MKIRYSLEPWLVFFFAAILRLIEVLAFPSATFPSYQVIFGGPIADAYYWHQVATEISVGEGLTTSLRPLYSIMMALLFQFFGYDVIVAKLLNVVLDSGTIMLGYLVFSRILPRPVPLVIAFGLALLPNYIGFSHSLLTEHAGAFFLMAALEAMLSGGFRSRYWWAVAGVMTGLGNLARPMTLFAIPFPAMVGLLSERSKFIKPLLACSITLVLTLAPWLALQYQQHGIISISSNTNLVLYAATDPHYGRWNNNIQLDKIAEGFPAGASIKQWDDLFKQSIVEHLSKHPEFYLKNVATAFWQSLNDGGLWLQQPSWLTVLLALSWMLCGVLLGCTPGHSGSIGSGLRLAGFATLLTVALATGLLILILIAGSGFMLWRARQATTIVVTYLVGCILSHCLFGFSSALDRLGLMYAPLLIGLQAAAFVGVGQALGELARPKRLPFEPAADPDDRQRQPSRSLKLATWIVLGLLVISIAKTGIIYGWQKPRFYSLQAVSSDAFPKLFDAVQQARPTLIDASTDVAMGRAPETSQHGFVAEVRFPLNYIRVPDRFSHLLATTTPLYVLYLSYGNVGSKWSIVATHDIKSLLGKQLVAVVDTRKTALETIPDLKLIVPMVRVLALAPLTPQGVDLPRLTIAE